MTDIKKYICDEIRYLNRNDYLKIRNIVLEHDPKKINEHPDGLRINLNDISKETLEQIYTFIKNQLEISNKQI